MRRTLLPRNQSTLYIVRSVQIPLTVLVRLDRNAAVSAEHQRDSYMCKTILFYRRKHVFYYRGSRGSLQGVYRGSLGGLKWPKLPWSTNRALGCVKLFS